MKRVGVHILFQKYTKIANSAQLNFISSLSGKTKKGKTTRLVDGWTCTTDLRSR